MRHSPHAPVDPAAPEAPGFCDRCNFKWLLKDLTVQHDYRGNRLVELGTKVCPRCLDEPQPSGQKPPVLGPEPQPLRNPRPGFIRQEVGTTIVPPAVEILGDDL